MSGQSSISSSSSCHLQRLKGNSEQVSLTQLPFSLTSIEGLSALDSWTCLNEKGSPRSIHVILEIVLSPCVSSCSGSMVSKAGTFLASQLSFLFLPWSRNLDWVIKVDSCYIQIILIDYWLFLLITCYIWRTLPPLWQKVLSPQVLHFSFKNPYILAVADVSFISSWNICVCECNLSTLLYSLITIIFPNICREKNP